MTVLLSPDAIAARRPVARASLAPLARSLRDELAPLLDAGTPWIPAEKARLTRAGGRCPRDGVLLDFDPWRPREHRCPVCATSYRDEDHYRWWVMNYQLWLAERSAHAAALYVLTDDVPCGALAADILRGYAARYASYPNRDNVLGPTRPFFSTYLESVWLLQLAVALDLLESRDGHTALGDELRERVIRPSATLIASYDEGSSNRQVYNCAAVAAAGALLGDEGFIAAATRGPSGLATLITSGLLDDGTWYEGENYHLFAHRGLWYGVTIADALGLSLPHEGLRRFREGFATPFATALPDFTFPSRRDSQYRVSLRQWRIAESCELGVARADDPRLFAALAALYDRRVPEGATARACSTAEAERNVAPVRLSRASLGWKSLLFARDTLPPLAERAQKSVHLAGQGIAVFRRDRARTYIALDYGESGGGHGHPDRLNLWLVVGDARILEDVGTGSYVDPTLHWYRSTLAHNAPLAEGRSQWKTEGALTAWDERADAGIVAARATIAPGVEVERTVVAMAGYLVDEVRWRSDRVITFDLPLHVDLDVVDGEDWRPATLAGGTGQEDGFDFVSDTNHLPGARQLAFAAEVTGVPVRLWSWVDAPHEWWRCVAPGPPGAGRRRFVLLRSRASSGCIRSVWSWRREIGAVMLDGEHLVVSQGAEGRHEHQRRSIEPGRSEWRIACTTDDGAIHLAFPIASDGQPADTGTREGSCEASQGGPPGLPAFPPPDAMTATGDASAVATAAPAIALRSSLVLPAEAGTLAGSPERVVPLQLDAPVHAAMHAHADASSAAADERHVARFALGRAHYRRSEQSWDEAGGPTAFVAVAASRDSLVVEVTVPDPSPVFAPPRADNPLDNEPPDINSDGVQLYLGASPGGGRYYAWILVPEGRDGMVRVTPRAAFGPAVAVAASARLTPDGWSLRATIPRTAVMANVAQGFTLDVIVNEISPDRERRRGQLVLSGGHDEWIYLRGDRQDPARALAFHITDD